MTNKNIIRIIVLSALLLLLWTAASCSGQSPEEAAESHVAADEVTDKDSGSDESTAEASLSGEPVNGKETTESPAITDGETEKESDPDENAAEELLSWDIVDDEETLLHLYAKSAGVDGFKTVFTEESAKAYLEKNDPYHFAFFGDNGRAIVFVSVDAGMGQTDYAVYRTIDYGATWKRCSKNYHTLGWISGAVNIDGDFWVYGYSGHAMRFFACRFPEKMTEMPTSVFAPNMDYDESIAGEYEDEYGSDWTELSFRYLPDEELYALEIGRVSEENIIILHQTENYQGPFVEKKDLRFNKDGSFHDIVDSTN